MRTQYPEYDVKYISGCMNLRKPQKRSLKILDTILEEIELKKNSNIDSALRSVHDICPTCSNFERDFISLTFALATGVGKTRLMGAFITYLYMKKKRSWSIIALQISKRTPLTHSLFFCMRDLGEASLRA